MEPGLLLRSRTWKCTQGTKCHKLDRLQGHCCSSQELVAIQPDPKCRGMHSFLLSTGNKTYNIAQKPFHQLECAPSKILVCVASRSAWACTWEDANDEGKSCRNHCLLLQSISRPRRLLATCSMFAGHEDKTLVNSDKHSKFFITCGSIFRTGTAWHAWRLDRIATFQSQLCLCDTLLDVACNSIRIPEIWMVACRSMNRSYSYKEQGAPTWNQAPRLPSRLAPLSSQSMRPSLLVQVLTGNSDRYLG